MSLQTQIGPECNIFEPAPGHARQIVLGSPILSQRKLRQILAIEEVTHEFIDLQYEPAEGLRRAILRLCAQAESAGARGKLVLLLSDSLPGQGPHSGPRAAGDRSGASASAEDRPALQVQPAHRDWHGARAASLRLPDRLWGDRGVSVHGVPGAVRD